MNEDEMMDKLAPFLNKAFRGFIEISREVPEGLINTFCYLLARGSLVAFISGKMDGVSVKKELHDLIKDLVDGAIEDAIDCKIIIEKFEKKE